jgi:TRAP-type C4-dicarboxylate transport system permease small subunit
VPRILYYFFIITIALLAVSFLRSIWDRYHRRNERDANDPEQFPERSPWDFPEKED